MENAWWGAIIPPGEKGKCLTVRHFIRRGAHYTPAALRVGDGVRYPARRVCGTMPSIVPYRLFVGLQHITKCSVGNGLDRSDA